MEKVVIGGATLYHGDCLEALDFISGVDAVVTDPPYNIPTQAAQTREATRTIGDLSMIEASFRLLFDKTIGIVGPTGRHFVFADGTSYPVIFRAVYGKVNTALLIWDKGRIGMGREFRKSHELILHAWGKETPVVSSNGVGFSDVLKRPPLSSTERVHPAQKPVALLEDILRVCGGVILDPFMGSGSTGEAALRLGKKFIGVEIEKTYFDIACDRLRRLNSSLDELI